MTDDLHARVRSLKFKHLLAFERAFSLGSTHKAARSLDISQPEVVRLVQQLELLLDVPLFERHATGLAPTGYADRLIERIKPLLGDARAMSEDLVEMRAGSRGHVLIGTSISASARLLPETVAALKERHPTLNVTIHEGPNSLLFPMLAAGELDLVIGRLPDEVESNISMYVLYEELIAVVVRSGHPVPANGKVTLRDLADYPWILPLPVSPLRAQIEIFFAGQGEELPANRIESLSLMSNLGILNYSDAIATLPMAAAAPFIENGLLRCLPIAEKLPFGKIGYSVRGGRSPTPAARGFINILKSTARKIARSLHNDPGK